MDPRLPPRAAPTSRDRWIVLAGVGIALLAFAAVSAAGRYAHLPLCVFHAVTGWHCPGCGGTRALVELVQGHWAAAFRLNPPLVSLLPLAVYGLARAARPAKAPVRVRPVWVGTLLAAVLLFAVLRNIPALPWAGLAP